jgi:hypothetical protein
MANNNTALVRFDALFKSKEKELLAQRIEVLSFLKTAHARKESEKFQATVFEAEAEITGLLLSLRSDATLAAVPEAEVEKLGQRGERLTLYIDRMKSDLDRDLAALRGKRVDWTKVATFFFGIPFGFVAVSRSGLWNHPISTEQAIEAGILVSGSILGHKPILRAVAAAGRLICRLPRKIGDRRGAAGNFYRQGAEAVSARFSTVVMRTNSWPMAISTPFNGHSPEP